MLVSVPRFLYLAFSLSSVILNEKWHFIIQVFYFTTFVYPNELKYWTSEMLLWEPLNMLIVYFTTMILMMYSPSEKSKGSFDFFFFFFRALKQRIRYWLNRIHHELWCYLKRVCDFSSKEEKGGEWMGWDAEACCKSCCDPEPWPLCRTADCEGQYNPQCLMLQWLIKYLMY